MNVVFAFGTWQKYLISIFESMCNATFIPTIFANEKNQILVFVEVD